MEYQNKLPTYFSYSTVLGESRPSHGVLIYPSPDNWNDFGHKTQFLFEILGTPYAVPHLFKLAFLGTATTQHEADVIKFTLQTEARELINASELPQFFSMQLGMQEYRNLVKVYGIELAEELLLSLNDLVAIRRRKPTPAWVEDATKSEAFTHSLIRNSAGFFAYYNAKSILSGLEEEDLHAVSASFKLTFKLSAFATEHKFNFSFDTQSLVPKRMAVLIGKNGVGKSQSLKKIVLSALDGNDNLTDSKGERPQISRIIAICTPGETESTFPQIPSKNSRINYLRLSAAPGERADSTDGQTLPEVILQLARYDEEIGGKKRWNIFREAVSRILPFEDLNITPHSSDFDFQILSNLSSGISLSELRYAGAEQRRLDAAKNLDFSGQLVRNTGHQYVPLSSGQLSFIRLAAQLCLHIENGSLLLIDEPETHLHPNLVSDLVAMLNQILELSGSIAIIATHSAYLVREVPSSQVHVIREAENGSVEVLQPRLKTFGADVGAISNFVFGDNLVNRLLEDVELRLKQAPEQAVNWRQQLLGELSTEAVMHLSREMRGSDGDEV